MADFEALEVVAGVSGLSRTAKRLINRFHEAYKHYPHIKHALDNCSDELTRLIDIIYLIEDEDVLQTAGVVTALTKLQAVEVALLRHLKTLQQGELSRGNPKKIEDITKDLDRAKSDVCLQIQTAPVGLTFTTNDTVIADAKVINRIDSLLLRFIGKGQGLKIASLLSEWDLQAKK
ncbi:hypothetical protein EJ04DRAFT_146081 [Polyplosphaeria fusca]|uniref:Uncharacterized protein n=1 Tax=Polyplosphaeria fusca TaxID=682080 RepID=A0A9P4QLT7_9PLEO|nr:hypothetical protein EJ04DRAFT_146081 [Polyplosphaeria fusca]